MVRSATPPVRLLTGLITGGLASLAFACGRCSTNATPPLPTPGLSPAWLSTIRTHAHTRLSPPDSYCNASTGVCKAVFNNTANLFSSIGVKAYVRHTHMGKDLNWWGRGPAEAQESIVRGTGRNLPAEFVAGAKAAGVRLIAYHYPRCHAYYSSNMPTWLNRDQDGKPVPNPRGNGLCINGGWGTEYVDQIGELVDFGIDGLYMDEFPSPPGGCWCDSCKALYRNMTGEEMPQPTTAENYRKVLEFNTLSVQRFTERVAERMAERSAAGMAAGNRSDPAIPFFSTHELPCPDNGGMLFETLRLVASGPVVSPKIEFDTANSVNCIGPIDNVGPFEMVSNDAVIAWGWVVNRDAATARLPHTWFPNSDDGVSFLRCAQGAMLTYGLVANPDHTESQIPNATLFNSTYSISAALEPVLTGTKPRRWAVVVFPSAQRNRLVRLSSAPPGSMWGNNTAVYSELMMGALGVFEQLVARGLPVGIASDWQLESHPSAATGTVPETLTDGGPGVVFVPAGANLTAEQVGGIEAFSTQPPGLQKRTSVNLSAYGSSMAWATAAGRSSLAGAVFNDVASAIGRPPVQVKAANPNDVVHGQVLAVPGQHGVGQVVMVSNAFAWCGERTKGGVKPAPVQGVTATVSIAPGTVSSDISAYDVFGKQALPLQVVSDVAVVQLNAVDVFLVVQLKCNRAQGAICFL